MSTESDTAEDLEMYRLAYAAMVRDDDWDPVVADLVARRAVQDYRKFRSELAYEAEGDER